MRSAVVILFVFFSIEVMAQPYKTITYNIRYDNPGDSINQWGNRKQKVFSLLKKYNPDILGVQEALHNQITDIKNNLNGYSFVGSGRDDGKEKGEYSAIYYNADKFDVIEKNNFWLSETPEVPGSKSWDAAITRIATWAKFKDKKNGNQFLVVNTHFDHIGKEARKKSAELLKRKVPTLAQKMPVIIMGDFNCTRDEPPYEVMLTSEGWTLNDSAPANPPGTFCSFAVNSIECKAIDYIFYSNQWKTVTYTVIQDHDGKYYPSDHLPVMADLTLVKK